VDTVHRHVCSGLFLLKLIKRFEPAAKFKIVHEKVLRVRLALENLDQAIGHMMRCHRLNSSRVPTAKEVYHGNLTKIWSFLFELFNVYAVRPWKGGQGPPAWRLLQWFGDILEHYDRRIPPVSVTMLPTADGKHLRSSNVPELCSHFRTGTDIFCTLYHFLGPVELDGATQPVAVDPANVFFDPATLDESRANVTYVFNLLRALHIEVMWDVDDWVGASDAASSDWIGQDDTLFVLLQLNLVHEAFKGRDSVFDAHDLHPGAPAHVPASATEAVAATHGAGLGRPAWDASTQLSETDRALRELNALLTTHRQMHAQDNDDRRRKMVQAPSLPFRTRTTAGALPERRPPQKEHTTPAAPTTIAIHVSPQQQPQLLSPQPPPPLPPPPSVEQPTQTITTNGVTVSISVGSPVDPRSPPPPQPPQPPTSSSSSFFTASSSSSSSRPLRMSSTATAAPISSVDWLPHVSKDVSHNVKLNQLRAEALAARQHVHHPPTLREKYALFEAEHYSPPAVAKYPRSPTHKPPLPPEALGSHHHQRNHHGRGDDNGGGHQQGSMWTLSASPTSVPRPCPLPVGGRDGADEEAIFADIRRKERRIMQVEDERRRLEVRRRQETNVH